MNRSASSPRLYRFGPRIAPAHTRFVREALGAVGWRQTDADDWSLFWDSESPGPSLFAQIGSGRFVNHFPGIAALTTKDGLCDTVGRARRGQPGRFSFHPETHSLPRDRVAFLAAVEADPDAIWIRKPKSASGGWGVRLLEDPVREADSRSSIVQRYVANPHLLGGSKYTIRFYVVVTSFAPLVAYVFDDGFVKRASRPFSTEPGKRSDRLVHLTNPDVQRESLAAVTSDKNLLHAPYREILRKEGVDDARLWSRIEDAMAGALVAAQGAVRRWLGTVPEPAGCFELVGFDILIDDRFEPWVIECNQGPSIAVEAGDAAATFEAEEQLKRELVRGTLQLAGVFEDAVPSDPFARFATSESNRGRFRRLFPREDARAWLPRFPFVGLADVRLTETLCGPAHDGARFEPCVAPHGVTELRFAGAVALHSAPEQRIHLLSDAAVPLWRRVGDRATPTQVAGPGDVEQAWAFLEWLADAGLVAPADAPAWRGDDAGTHVRASLPLLGWNQTRVARLGDTTIAIDFPDAATEATALPAIGHLLDPAAARADARLEIVPDPNDESPGATRREPRWLLLQDDATPVPVSGLDRLVGVLQSVLLAIAHRHRGFVALRGTAVAIGDSAVLLAGPPGSGRTALAAALDAAGAALLSDEWALLAPGEPGELLLRPTPIAMAVHEEALGLVGPRRRELLGLPLQLHSDGRRVRHLAPRRTLREPRPLHALVFPGHRDPAQPAEESRPRGLQPLAPVAALQRCLAYGAHAEPRLDADTARAFLAGLETTQAFEIDSSDFARAVDALLAWKPR